MNFVLANYAYDLLGNVSLLFGYIAVVASLVQMFQIGTMRRQIETLEARLSDFEGSSEVTVTK